MSALLPFYPCATTTSMWELSLVKVFVSRCKCLTSPQPHSRQPTNPLPPVHKPLPSVHKHKLILSHWTLSTLLLRRYGRAQQIRYALAVAEISFRDECPEGFPATPVTHMPWVTGSSSIPSCCHQLILSVCLSVCLSFLCLLSDVHRCFSIGQCS